PPISTLFPTRRSSDLAVYVAVSIPEPGRVKHLARGDLIIGPPSTRTTKVADAFIRAGISCRISENIEGELWLKLLRNCALNAIRSEEHTSELQSLTNI